MVLKHHPTLFRALVMASALTVAAMAVLSITSGF